jgi:hypothetical protein
MWEHYKVFGEDDGPEVCRPCGRFSLHAGDILLGHSDLDRETVGEEGFYRVGEFEPVWEGYLHYREALVQYNRLKLEQQARLPAYKQMPELDASEHEVKAMSLRLVAPNGQDVPTQRLEIADFGRGDGCELEVFISEEPIYLRFFPPDAKKI